MRMVWERADARWMPSRYSFALFRLYAYLRMKNAAPERGDVVLVVAQQQSALENYSVSLWVLLTTVCFLTQLFPRLLLPVAFLVAIPLAAVVLEVPMHLVGAVILPLATRGASMGRNNIRINSIVTMAALAATAAYYARSSGWIRFVAWQFLGLIAINALCAVIVTWLEPRIARLENAYGGTVSDV